MRIQGTHKGRPYDSCYNKRIHFSFSMRFSLLRSLQWLGVAVVLFAIVGLTYDFNSEAGKTMNAPVEDALSQGLLGYWKMDEGTGTSTTADSSGNANTLTMTAMESGDWVAGQIGAFSLDFDGSAEWLTVADPASGILDFTDGRDFTITGWFNRDTFTTDDTVVAKRNGIANTDDGYILYIDDATDQLILEVSEAGGTDEYQVASTSTFTATGWNHFAAVWDDGNATQTEIYINGKADGTDTGTIANLGDLSNAVAFDIGAESDNGNPFDGKIDDVRIYGSALPANEVSKLYQTTVPGNPVDTGLVGHWTFDGPDVTWGDTSNEIKDVSGHGNHGDAAGSLSTTSVTPGKLGQALSFNGTSDYANVNVDTIGTGAVTISAWIFVRSAGGSGYGSIISNRHTSLQLVGYDNKLLFSNDDVNTWATSASGSIQWSTWYFVVGVRKSDGTVTLYVNGTQSGATDQNAGTRTAGPDTTLGASMTGSYEFDGVIDDIRIYNRVLSTMEIVDLYNMGK